MKHFKIASKGLKITLIVIGIVVALLLLVAVLVSPIAKSYIEKNSPELIGRQINMDKLRVNLFNASVKIYGFHLSEQDMKTDFVTFDTLRVAINPFKLLSKEVKIRYITLVNPDIKIENLGKRFNFSDLLELGSDSADTDTTPSEWAIGIYNIELRGGKVKYTDVPIATSWALNNLHLEIPGLYFGGQATDAGISFQFADGGSLETQAQYDADREAYTLDLKLNQIRLQNAYPFVKGMFNDIGKIGGTLSGKLKVDGSLANITNLNVAGNINVRNVALNTSDNDQLASLAVLDLNINRINPYENTYDLETLRINGFNFHFDILADGGNNFSRIFSSDDSTAVNDTTPTAPDTLQNTAVEEKPITLKITHIDVDDVNLTVNDYTLAQPFTYPITKINVKTDNFVLGDQEKGLLLRAQLPNAGSVMVRWKGGATLAERQSLYVSIRNLAVKNFSPYVMHYLGYPVSAGVLSYVSENKLNNYQLDSKNKVDIFNLSVEKKDRSVKPEYNIPLRTALYILKDKDDKIEFDIPVKGNVNSPEFSYTKIIFKTLGNLLVKVALSPMSYMANTLGLSKDELSFVDISLFQRDFTSEQYDKFGRLAELVKADPDLTLTLEQNIDYPSAAKDLPLFELKREYYLSQNPDKRSKPLTIIDITSIESIKDRDKGFRSFATNYLNSDGNFEQALAQRFPADTIDARLTKLMEMRNRYVNRFLVEKMELPQEQIVVKSQPLKVLKDGKHGNRYEVSVKTNDANLEQIE